MSFSVQFEQLMNNGSLYDTEDRPVLDLVDATMECMDILEEITQLEGNLFVYEAVMHVKKAKANKKKIKTKTTKMKAKDAKAKKAGGKVVKIVKEGDTDGQTADGGTGPVPTTSDTNGLTDTDLDADPDAEVEVTEIADGEDETAPAATESADLVMEGGEKYLVVYEDSSIYDIAMEADKIEGNFVQRIIQLIKKVGDLISSFIAKVISFFSGEKKFLEANKDKMTHLDQKAKLPSFGGYKPEEAVGKIFASLNGIIASAKAIDKNADLKIDDVDIMTPDGTTNLKEKFIGVADKERTLSAAGISTASYDYFINKFPNELKKIRNEWRNVEQAFKKIDKDDAMQVKKNITGAHKAINVAFGITMQISRKVLGTMRLAAKEPSKDGK